jgi:hypothetical protein
MLNTSLAQQIRDGVLLPYTTAICSGDIVADWCKFAPGTKTLVCCGSVKECEEVVRAFKDAGVVASMVRVSRNGVYSHIDRPDFDSGSTTVLCGFLGALEFNSPQIETVIIAREVTSKGLFEEMFVKPLTKNGIKERGTVIDCGGNIARFGVPR